MQASKIIRRFQLIRLKVWHEANNDANLIIKWLI